jgi:hypothetical protein
MDDLAPGTIAAICGLAGGIGLGFGALVRVGGGDLKSFVTFLVKGISAYATMNGAAAYLRVGLFPQASTPSQPAGIAHLVSANIGGTPHIWAYAIGVLLLAWVLYPAKFRGKYRKLFAGVCLA